MVKLHLKRLLKGLFIATLPSVEIILLIEIINSKPTVNSSTSNQNRDSHAKASNSKSSSKNLDSLVMNCSDT